MADVVPKVSRDRHPELSAPIVDLSLEAQIARAEQAVIDREARIRGDALRIVGTLRSKRGATLRWAGIAGAVVAAVSIGYMGYISWRVRKGEPTDKTSPTEQPKLRSLASDIAAIARVTTQWALKLHREQGVSGALFGLFRAALWPDSRTAPNAAAPAATHSSPPGGFDGGN